MVWSKGHWKERENRETKSLATMLDAQSAENVYLSVFGYVIDAQRKVYADVNSAEYSKHNSPGVSLAIAGRKGAYALRA